MNKCHYVFQPHMLHPNVGVLAPILPNLRLLSASKQFCKLDTIVFIASSLTGPVQQNGPLWKTGNIWEI